MPKTFGVETFPCKLRVHDGFISNLHYVITMRLVYDYYVILIPVLIFLIKTDLIKTEKGLHYSWNGILRNVTF
jgi:hypothetical protein